MRLTARNAIISQRTTIQGESACVSHVTYFTPAPMMIAISAAMRTRAKRRRIVPKIAPACGRGSARKSAGAVSAPSAIVPPIQIGQPEVIEHAEQQVEPVRHHFLGRMNASSKLIVNGGV